MKNPMINPSNPPEDNAPTQPEITRLSDRTVVMVLELSEKDWADGIPRFIHVSDPRLAAPIVPMLQWAITKGGEELGALPNGPPAQPLGLVGAMDGDDGPFLVALGQREAVVVEPMIRLLAKGWENMVRNPKEVPPQRLREPGHAWVELRGWPVKESLEIREYAGEPPVIHGATLKVELATGVKVTVVREHRDRAELERQCQEIFDAGDVVLSGPMVLMEDEALVVATRWEPVIGLT